MEREREIERIFACGKGTVPTIKRECLPEREETPFHVHTPLYRCAADLSSQAQPTRAPDVPEGGPGDWNHAHTAQHTHCTAQHTLHSTREYSRGEH